MGYYQTALSGKATGNIGLSTFVKLDTSNPNCYLQCGAGDTPIGVGYPGTDTAPGTAGATAYSAVSGEEVLVYTVGSVIEIQVGAVDVLAGPVKPDANGCAIAASGSDVAGAIALVPGAAGTFIRCLVIGYGSVVATPQTAVLSVSANTTLTVAQSGIDVVVTAADKVITVPTATAAGLRYKVIATGTGATGGSTGTTVHVPTGDTLAGNGFTAASGKGAINTHATAASGDWIEITSVAANTWYITGILGTWAREA